MFDIFSREGLNCLVETRDAKRQKQLAVGKERQKIKKKDQTANSAGSNCFSMFLKAAIEMSRSNIEV